MNLPFAARLRRYRHLAKKVNRLLKTGGFQMLSSSKKSQLLRQLKLRIQRISHLFPKAKLKGALAGIALLLGGATANGQTFAPVQVNPFGLTNLPSGYGSFADLDGDGDLDFHVYSYDNDTYENNFLTFVNTGDAQNPSFSEDNLLIDAYGIENVGYNSSPIFVDIDNDGDLDLLTGNLYGGDGAFRFQENIGTATAPSFGPTQISPFGIQNGNYINFAAAIDIDGDGDIDLFGSDVYGTMLFYENSGTASAPSFGSPESNPFGITISSVIGVPTFGDLDADGDYDLIYFAYYPGVGISYQKNTGTPTAPQFATPINSPFGIAPAGAVIPIPTTADIDGDADIDVFINDYYGANIHFYENLNINTPVAPTAADNTVIMQEDGIYTFNQIDFNFADLNSSDVLEAVEITELPNKGVLRLGANVVTQGQIIQVGDISSLIFDSELNEFGNIYSSFKFKVSDGTLWSATDNTMAIVVTPLNDPPTTEDSQVTTAKDFPALFDASDFPFDDVDGDALSGIKIVSLPSKGDLKLGTNTVAVGQSITTNNIANLSYKSLPGEFGDNYASFGFQVIDGTAFSAQKTMTINILESSTANDQALNAAVKLFPNPVGQELQLSVNSEQTLGDLTVNIANSMGQVVFTNALGKMPNDFAYKCDVSSLQAGVYFLKLEADGKFTTTRFVKL